MADTKISGLPAAGAAASANELPINEAGTSKKLTVGQIIGLAWTRGGSWTAFTKDLGVARSSGTFDITGLSSQTADKPVSIMQTAAAIASKGNARDESEMDTINVTGYVVDATTIRAYWHSSNGAVCVGDYAFAYLVSG